MNLEVVMTRRNPERNTFLDDATQKLNELVQERDKLATELASLDEKIAGLQTYVAEASAGSVTSITRATLSPVVKIEKAPKFRGKQIILVLDILKSSGVPQTLDGIIAESKERGTEINRDSLRSQLARASVKGPVVKRGEYYVYKEVSEQR